MGKRVNHLEGLMPLFGSSDDHITTQSHDDVRIPEAEAPQAVIPFAPPEPEPEPESVKAEAPPLVEAAPVPEPMVQPIPDSQPAREQEQADSAEPIAESPIEPVADHVEANHPEPVRRPKGGKGTRPGDVHRSLYAKPETIDAVRRLAFQEGVTAQHLYRQALLMLLNKKGFFIGKTVDEM